MSAAKDVAANDIAEVAEPEAPSDGMIVQLTVGQLRALLRVEVDRAVDRVLGAKPPVKSPRWVDAEEAAQHFGVTSATIRNWCAAGAPHRRIGAPGKVQQYRIELPLFEAWVDDAQPRTGAK